MLFNLLLNGFAGLLFQTLSAFLHDELALQGALLRAPCLRPRVKFGSRLTFFLKTGLCTSKYMK